MSQVDHQIASIDNRYDCLLRHSPDAVLIAEAESLVIVASNEMACTYAGVGTETLRSQSLTEFFAPQTIQRLREYVASKPDANAAALELDCSIYSRKVNELIVEISARVDRDGEDAFLVICAEETTKRRKTESRLRRSERLYYLLAENLLGFIWAVDRDLKFTYVSPSVVQIRGYTHEDMMEQTLASCFSAESYDKLLGILEEERKKPVPDRSAPIPVRTLEAQMTRKSGGLVWTEITLSVYRRSGSGPLGFVAVSRDISDRKSAEREKEDFQRQIQQAQKLESLGVLAGGIAHDFNNLLTGVLGYASLLKSDLPGNSDAQAHADQIERAAHRAHILTKQMLAYSGQGTFDVRTFDLRSMVDEIAGLLQFSVSKKVTLDYEHEDESSWITADTAQIQQVIMNLITNAADALGDKTGEVTLRTGTLYADREYLSQSHIDDDLPEGRYVFLEVSDTGCGMDEETISKIFDPFFTTKFTGRGLGLAAVLGIVRAHEGAIQIESEPGSGSVFRVLLPALADAGMPVLSDIPVKTPALPAEQIQVLVADDDEFVRKLLRDILSRTGLDVLVACDGQEALELFREHRDEIRMVILDLTMPKLDGAEALAAIREIDQEVPIALSSGYAEEEVRSRIDNWEDIAFVQKPFQRRELLSSIRRILFP